MLLDRYGEYGRHGVTSPAERFFSITPNDTNDLPELPRALYVGGAGNLAVVDKHGNAVVLLNVLAGSLLSIRPARVRATGTTATGLIGLS